MPKELVAVDPRKPVLREYEEPVLGNNQVRIRTEFASPKHGTEMVFYRDEQVSRKGYDRELGCMVEREDDAHGNHFPLRLGNMAVGVVTEVGTTAGRFNPGQRVFGHLPVRETHTVDETAIDPMPEGISPEAIVCLDPLVMALAMRDVGIRIGDRVAVFGLGAIGLMAVQLARLAGADAVIAVDPIAGRRELALSLGASDALDPAANGGDVGLAIRRRFAADVAPSRAVSDSAGISTSAALMPATHVVGGYREIASQTGQRGVDVAVEASGNVQALQDAIRSTRFGGRICMLSFYGGDSAALRLGEEFHVNRQELISARIESLPLRDSPAWTLKRVVELALKWLVDGRIKTDGIVAPIVPFTRSAEMYRRIDEHPEESTKLGFTFGA